MYYVSNVSHGSSSEGQGQYDAVNSRLTSATRFKDINLQFVIFDVVPYNLISLLEIESRSCFEDRVVQKS